MTERLPARCLTLDPSARIVAAGDQLHVVQRRGAFDLRGKGLEQLHERLAPILDGRFTRAQVLASAGALSAAVDRYLTGLAASGVLREGDPPHELPADFPRARCGVQALRVGARRVAVSLAGAESSDTAALRLSFAPRADIERRLLELRAPRRAAGRIWIECDGPAGAHELARRASIARYLLAIALGAGVGHELGIFRLAPDKLVLERRALVAAPSAPLESLPVQLGVVRLLERPQLPLVAMVAELPGLGLRRVGYGLDAQEIRAALTVELLAREALLAGPGHRLADAVAAGRGARVAIAASRESLVEALLCSWAARSRRAQGRDSDALTVDPPSARVAALQNVLGRRRRAWPVRIDDRLAPLTIVRSAAGTVVRVGAEEAHAETLLRAIARELDLDEPGAVACAPSPLEPALRRRRARAVIAQLPRSPIALTERIRWLGASYWAGLSAP